MKYKIEWIERSTTKTGKIKADATIVDEKGVQTEKVTIWGDFPEFGNIMAGHEVWGDLVVKQNGQYTNKTLYPGKTDTLSNPKAPSWATQGGNKFTGTKAAQERKEAMIERAQERKNDSIAFFNSTNAAIEVVSKLSFIGEKTQEEYYQVVEKNIKRWRDWFLSEWERYNALPHDQKSQPF